MVSRIDIASRAAGKAQADAPPTAAEESARPADDRPSRAARLFALFLLPIVYFANTLFSSGGDANAMEEEKRGKSPGEDDGGAVDPVGRMASRIDGINADKNKPAEEPAGNEIAAVPHTIGARRGTDPLDNIIDRALGGPNIWPAAQDNSSGAEFAELMDQGPEVGRPETLGGSGERSGGGRDATGGNGGTPSQPSEANDGVGGGTDEPDSDASSETDGGDAIARLFEDMGHWFGDLPTETVARVTDLVVGDLMREVPMEEILRQSGLVEDPAGAGFAGRVTVLRDPSAREAFAERMGVDEPMAPEGETLTMDTQEAFNATPVELG